MLRPYVFSLHAGAPHHRRARARLHALAARRLAVPGSARISGAAREIARSQARRRRERRASRAGVGRWDEAGGLVSDTKVPNLRWPPLVLRQRSEERRVGKECVI